jgi:hypothetical protein
MSNNPRADHQWKDKILRRERFADFAYTLARVNWDFFTTHTFKNPLPRPYVRGAMFWRWCRDVSEFSGVPYKNLLIALRGEQGEIGGRPHFHALIGGLTACNMMSLRSRMMRSWKIISGNADADFRLYDRSLAGADYICKCLGANAYEGEQVFTCRRNNAVRFSLFPHQEAGFNGGQTLPQGHTKIRAGCEGAGA